jgi:predicted pyridoxine 5'-phosphate oxidase superfamily flavin-nucleotide-binding protein
VSRDEPNWIEEKKMSKLSEEVRTAWDNREGAIVLTTVDKMGVTNSIYATCVKKTDEDEIVVADNYFCKTRANILDGSTGSILFITGEGKSYQIKGSLAYCSKGAEFDEMKQWNDPKHPGIAATVLTVETVYKGAEQLA